MPWGSTADDGVDLDAQLRARGVLTAAIEAELIERAAPVRIFDVIEEVLGPVLALVLARCHYITSGILDTAVECVDHHVAVNTRAVGRGRRGD